MKLLRSPYPLMLLHLILGVLTLIIFDGTGDSGDSIYHYLYARSAPDHPELYFDHWAKPLFVLLYSPMAQIGFIGVQLLNLLVVNATLYFTYQTAKKLDIPSPYFTLILLIFSPLYFVLTFSGLTEPLFAFFLILAFFMQLNKRHALAIVLISFLPFVRSEGLFFIGIFGLWEVLRGRYTSLLFLLTGSFIYGLAGYFVHNDFFWTITKIPYSKLSSTYGSGTALHFIEQLIYVVGIPFYLLFWIGFLFLTVHYFLRRTSFKLVYFLLGSVVAFILAHTIFWYYGIFNSMGLKRVLICVIPFMALIATYGLSQIQFILQHFSYRLAGAIVYIFALYTMVFPFTKNPAAIDFKHDLNLHVEQVQANKIANYINAHYKEPKIIVGNTYFCEILNIDCFDPSRKSFITPEAIETAQPGDLIIWDNWFSIVEHGISLDYLINKPNFKLVFETENTDNRERYSKMVLFEVY